MKKRSASSYVYDIDRSRSLERDIYVEEMRALYSDSVRENAIIYDLAFELTDKFRAINPENILKDSRIIKLLRYSVAPSISQMKFGQMFGKRSTDVFEKEQLPEAGTIYSELRAIAPGMAKYLTDNIDKRRFSWLNTGLNPSPEVCEWVKSWTCSIAADQNSQTAYRTLRKKIQESKISAYLQKRGYVKTKFRGVIKSVDDIARGEFSSEVKVLGRTKQKADFAFRQKVSGQLVLIEAKAVGVELDATKRTKECCDKANDWRSSRKLSSPCVVAVLAGYFAVSNLASLLSSKVIVAWEHNLSEMDYLT